MGKMQGVKRRSNGLLEKRFTFEGHRYSIYGHTQKELEVNEKNKRLELAAGIYQTNKVITLDTYWKEWIERKGKTAKENTIRIYTILYKHISPILGRCKVKEIERRQVIRLQKVVADKASISTANYCVSLLSSILKSARLDDITMRNVAENIPKIKDSEKESARDTIHRALTGKELQVFFKYAQKSIYYNLFRFLLTTGARVGECTALQWRDVEWNRDKSAGVIHITRTATRTVKGKATLGNSTKTLKSRRDIPINEGIKAILEGQYKRYTGIHGNITGLNDFIFPNTFNSMADPCSVETALYALIRKINNDGETLKRFSLHAFRATFASMAAADGVPLNVLKELLGHSSYAMTADLYGHIYEDQKEKAMNGLNIVNF